MDTGTGNGMGTQYANEKSAIETLRAKHSSVGAKTLAKQITYRNFPDAADNALAGKCAGRTFFSTYSVIRRYDAKRRTKGGSAAVAA